MAVNGVSGLACLISLFLPFHRVSFFTHAAIVPLRVYMMSTYLVAVDVDFYKRNDFCVAAQSISKFKCKDLDEIKSIEEMRDRFCVDSVRLTMRGACEGMSAAHTIGILLALTAVTNMALQGVSVLLGWQYLTQKPKKSYRKQAVVLNIVGFGGMFILMGLYWGFVIFQLNMMSTVPLLRAMLQPSNDTFGCGLGFIILGYSMFLQTIAMYLFKSGKSSEEEFFEEAREQQKFEAEMAALEAPAYRNNPRPPQVAGGFVPSAPYPPQGCGGFGPGAPLVQQGGGFAPPPPHGCGGLAPGVGTTAPPRGWGGPMAPQPGWSQARTPNFGGFS
eukprot:TRINITY_DN32792_c0_g1_i1.p1 TRINITY_DN32792_c0_g1~~TRINITY_DN32792_c0_g1_i1.p1  ORF type:complete len:359 (-),score=48.86 TRINITY_DN32792_c0_g1_i1:277-1269(-)